MVMARILLCSIIKWDDELLSNVLLSELLLDINVKVEAANVKFILLKENPWFIFREKCRKPKKMEKNTRQS